MEKGGKVSSELGFEGFMKLCLVVDTSRVNILLPVRGLNPSPHTILRNVFMGLEKLRFQVFWSAVVININIFFIDKKIPFFNSYIFKVG